MPWQEADHQLRRRQFIDAWLIGRYSTSRLCDAFQVSRKTGYKWIGRFKAEGMNNLVDRSRARHHQAHKTPHGIVQILIDTKVEFPQWGPRKVVNYLRNTQPEVDWPVHSTANNILSGMDW